MIVTDNKDYYDEEHYYAQDKQLPLVDNAAGFGRSVSPAGFQTLDYSDPVKDVPVQQKPRSLLSRVLGRDDGKYPLEQRIENKRRGIGRQRRPYLVWALTAVMISVFIYESVVNWQAQRTPFSFKPTVNPMLGPSSSALIHVGARFVPCMKPIEGVPLNFALPCLNNTANPPTIACSLSDVCGFGGFKGDEPDQWFRFFTPIFLHAGLIHLALNMIAHFVISAHAERELGSVAFFILYFSAGVFGNVLGANFAILGSASTGASGAIFGTVAVEWIDLAFHWKIVERPVRRLVFLIIDIVIGVAIGYIPYVDNFAHLGGLFMGLFVATIFFPVISRTKRHKIITLIVRIAAIPIPIILFVVLTRNFYTGNPYSACSFCRYLSCFPTSSNNYCHDSGLIINGTQLNT
ncbi:hypothetical protein M422DRAFT_29657 [Sphaerobolus stellatus SS14]|uniref:Rhomboid-type serine protease n=1 Tax=Sphaerobolus stellatus (strain SS14) TaxID=990650 RepID=A0A0C9URN1_SPHS4|nr:hypothetical protein M422DRAFT_29657 [Sphaerobolus stellatus SS14]